MKEPEIQDVFVEINDIRGRLIDLENQSVVFNNTIIALALMANVKPNGFRYITPEDYRDLNHRLGDIRESISPDDHLKIRAYYSRGICQVLKVARR